MEKEKFNTDLIITRKHYPFIECDIGEIQGYPYVLTDNFEISDDEGCHWGTFRASIHFPETYPKGVPIMKDLSKEFPWEVDWHMSSKTGECCVCGVIESEEISKEGISILSYIQTYVIPFYANQLYKQEYGEYKNGEYDHYKEGVWQALEEEFNTKDRDTIFKIINEMKITRGRNDICFCSSGIKYKKCHLNRIDIIKSVLNTYLSIH